MSGAPPARSPAIINPPPIVARPPACHSAADASKGRSLWKKAFSEALFRQRNWERAIDPPPV
jgi:hypothetical protein